MAQLKPSAYQLVALTKLLCNGQNAILICDGVGVGKTISAAYILTYLSAALRRSALVVCPPSLQDKWYLELKTKFQIDAVNIRSGEELNLTIDHWDVATTRPQVFILPSSLLTAANGVGFSGPVVIDEIHNYRNSQTQLWAGAKSLVVTASHRIGLSATPINNSVSDLAAELSILLNLNIHIADALVQDIWRPGRQEALYPLMTRFAKDQLRLHFAKRQVHDVRIAVTDAYREQVIAVVKSLRGRPKSESIYRDEITYFRLAASSPRAFAVSTGVAIDENFEKVTQLKVILALHESEPVIVFCEFEETARELEAEISTRSTFIITGSVAVFLREGILDQFRNDRTGVLIMTSVGAEGIDLQFCSTVINYDLNWNPMVLEQRIGRIDRIGQEKSTISIYNFVVEGSIDERIIQTLGRKLGLVEGSVLEPSTVLEAVSLEKGPLFTDVEFAGELKRAQLLAEAVSLTSTIIPQDYDLIPAVDISFCSPEKIGNAGHSSARLEWLREGNASGEEWRQNMHAQRDALEKSIRLYSD